MRTGIKALILGGMLAAAFNDSKAQFVEDALRFTQPNPVISPRVAGLGVAYSGIADDFGALFVNPSGLTLIPRNEFSLGLGFTRFSNETNFFNINNPFASNTTTVTNAGFAVPFRIDSKPAAIAIGYVLENDFENINKFSAFNPSSSIVDFYTQQGGNINDNFAYNLFLADTVNGKIFSPVRDSVQQSAYIKESGGLHALSGGIGYNLSDYVSVGGSVTLRGGTYRYSREFIERDVTNKYNFLDQGPNFSNTDFDSLTIDERLIQEIEGVGGTLGVQVRVEDFLRLGVTIKTPVFYTISEDFSQSGNVRFDEGTVHSATGNEGKSSYNLTTPYVFGAGLSFHALGMTFSAGAEYTDVTQTTFSDASIEGSKNFENLNRTIVGSLVGQTRWGAGIEYEIPASPFVVRGSYTSISSPYMKDIANATTRITALGGGIFLAKNVRLDGVFRWTEQAQLRSNYAGSSYTLTQRPLNIAAQLTYRF